MEYNFDYEPNGGKKRGLGGGMIALIIMVAIIFGTLLGAGVLYALTPQSNDINASIMPSAKPSATAEIPKSTSSITYNPNITGLPNYTAPPIENMYEPAVEIYEKLSDTVVIVNIYSHEQRIGYGSGVIFTEDGYVITNNHVAAEGDKITITLCDDTELPVTIIGLDERTDLALLKIDDDRTFHAASLGVSADLKVGQTLIAIGSPLGYIGTTTQGIVSGLDRMIDANGRRMKMIQTDCALNPGNSGGPMFNRHGEVVGIVCRKDLYTYTDTSMITVEGCSFAIPIDIAKNVILQIMQKGYVERPGMGITARSMVNSEQTAYIGVEVIEVNAGSGVEAAGMKVGDCIIEFNGEKIIRMEELSSILDECTIGQTVNVKVLRNGKTVSLDITLGILAG